MQEQRMELDNESVDDDNPEPRDHNAAQSTVDSGVCNTSIHSGERRPSLVASSRDTNANEEVLIVDTLANEGPVMTSSPRPKREKTGNAEGDTDNLSPTETGRKRGMSIVLLGNSGETETDDDFLEEAEVLEKEKSDESSETEQPDITKAGGVDGEDMGEDNSRSKQPIVEDVRKFIQTYTESSDNTQSIATSEAENNGETDQLEENADEESSDDEVMVTSL